MSYLSRISSRIGRPGTTSHAVMPKGLNKHQPAAIARMEQTEEEEASVAAMRTPAARQLRRQQPEEEETEAQRQPNDEVEGEEVAPLRRQEAEEEDDIVPLRRQQVTEKEEELAPLRRQQATEEEEEAVQPMRSTIARQEEVPLDDTRQTLAPPSQASLEPGAEPVRQEFANEEEPSTLQALHRDMSPALSQPVQQSFATGVETSKHHVVNSASAEVSAPAAVSVPELAAPDLTMSDLSGSNAFNNNAPPLMTESNDTRANVIIDQLDVLIHEPSLPASQSPSPRNRERSLRARYLHRL